MEDHFPPTREEFYHMQMDVKHVQATQSSHADRLLRLEKRQADDAALKSVWNSPFPSVLGGTPQQGPIQTPSAEIFDDFDDEHGQNLLGNLQLDTEEEPVRRGASRANSVRFDVSAIQGASWAQGGRVSTEIGLVRPSSVIGSHPMMERSFSHKSDGRHSSAGYSVHSIHSAPSGRTSSLGLDTNFVIGDQNDDSPLDIPGPPPGLFILGSVPAIIRCWLKDNFSHSALLYAVICTGSQNSLLDFSLVRELGMIDQLRKNTSGRYSITLPVYLPEALVIQQTSRANGPAPNLPNLTATFTVIGVTQLPISERGQAIRVFLGSDTLRAHNGDILFSQNRLTLYGDDHNKLSVPFVRPEDEILFKNICTVNVATDKLELNANAVPFTPANLKTRDSSSRPGRSVTATAILNMPSEHVVQMGKAQDAPIILGPQVTRKSRPYQSSDLDITREVSSNDNLALPESHENQHSILLISSSNREGDSEARLRVTNSSLSGSARRESSSSIWGSWRSGGASNMDSDVNGDSTPTSSYQPASRGGRSMKVLKPSRASQRGRSSSSARTGATYEPPPRISGESRRKSQSALWDNNAEGSSRWESQRTLDEEKRPKELHALASKVKSSNPIGSASAFAWMNTGKSIAAPSRAD